MPSKGANIALKDQNVENKVTVAGKKGRSYFSSPSWEESHMSDHDRWAYGAAVSRERERQSRRILALCSGPFTIGHISHI